MLICGANYVIGVGQLAYTAVGIFRCWYCSGTGTAGTGLLVLVLLVRAVRPAQVLSVYTAV